MKRYSMFAAGLALLSVSILVAAEKIDLEGVSCPVSGKAAKEGTGVAYKGGEVFFCCTNCPNAFKANTAKFAEKANHQLAKTGQATQVKCPLTGRDLNPDATVEVDGVTVTFCCNNCKGKATAAEDKVALIFTDKNFEKGYKVGEKK